MLNALRPGIDRVARPLAGQLLRAGVGPNAVTLGGTLGVVLGALGLFARGSFLLGTVVVFFSVLTDMLDGAMARERGVSSRFGAWLDSTCDRVADAALFTALAWWFTGGGDDRTLAAVALYCLVGGVVVSYAKARAEGLGMRCDVGLAERAERVALVLLGTFLVGLGAPTVVLAVALWLLAAATTVTVLQRAAEVWRQAAPAS